MQESQVPKNIVHDTYYILNCADRIILKDSIPRANFLNRIYFFFTLKLLLKSNLSTGLGMFGEVFHLSDG